MRTVAFCEIEDFPRRVLAKHWPEVPIYRDIRDLTAKRLSGDGITVDLVCGGFPCQDISTASDAPAGLAGARSGLWREYARLVGELRPKFVVVENVSALTHNGLGDVLGDLAAIGYDAEWHCIPASSIGAPHPRDRIWIVAHSPQVQWKEQCRDQQGRLLQSNGSRTIVDDERRRNGVSDWWTTEPVVGRLVHGVSSRVDRLGCASNAVVPMISEMIGRAIMSVVKSETQAA